MKLLQESWISPERFSAYIAAGGAVMALLIRGGEWAFAKWAARASVRRTDMSTLLDRAVADLDRAEKERDEARQETERERQLRFAAERDRAHMEGIMYRLGFERGPQGAWRRNGGTDESK